MGWIIGKEETSFYHDQGNSTEDFSNNTSQYKGNLPDISDLPSTSQERPESNKDKVLKSFVCRKYGKSLKLDSYNSNILEVRNRTTEFTSGGILFKPKGEKGGQLKPQIVLKPVKGRLEYNDAKVAEKAMKEFKTLLELAVESEEERDRIRQDNEGILVDTNTVDYVDNDYPGLMDKEKTQISGVRSEEQNMDPNLRKKHLMIRRKSSCQKGKKLGKITILKRKDHSAKLSDFALEP